MQLSSIMCRGMDVIWHDRDYKIHDTTLKLIENYICSIYNTMCQCGWASSPGTKSLHGADEIAYGQPKMQPLILVVNQIAKRGSSEAPCAYKWYLNGRLRQMLYDFLTYPATRAWLTYIVIYEFRMPVALHQEFRKFTLAHAATVNHTYRK